MQSRNRVDRGKSRPWCTCQSQAKFSQPLLCKKHFPSPKAFLWRIARHLRKVGREELLKRLVFFVLHAVKTARCSRSNSGNSVLLRQRIKKNEERLRRSSVFAMFERRWIHERQKSWSCRFHDVLCSDPSGIGNITDRTPYLRHQAARDRVSRCRHRCVQSSPLQRCGQTLAAFVSQPSGHRQLQSTNRIPLRCCFLRCPLSPTSSHQTAPP